MAATDPRARRTAPPDSQQESTVLSMKTRLCVAAAAAIAAVMAGCQSSNDGAVNARTQPERLPSELRPPQRGYERPREDPPEPFYEREPEGRPAARIGSLADCYNPNMPDPLPANSDQQYVAYAMPSGLECTSQVLVEQVSPRQVVRGQSFEYLYRVTNIADCPVDNTILTITNEANLAISGSDPSGQRGPEGYFWDLGRLEIGESKLVRVTASADQPGTADGCVTVDYDPILCNQIEVIEPALQLVKSATPSALTCDEVILTYRVTNTGTGVATGVRVRDSLPNGLAAVDGTRQIDVEIGDLAGGESREFRVRAEAAGPGTYASVATATGGAGLRADSGNPETVITQPSFTIESECRDTQFVGRETTVTFLVSNSGGGDAPNAQFTVSLPASAEITGVSGGGQITAGGAGWALGSFPAGTDREFTVTYRGTSQGTIRAEGRISGECADAAATVCETEYRGVPAILLEVVDVVDPIEVGDQTTYVLRVTNQGSTTLTNVEINAEMPEELAYVSSGGVTNGNIQGRSLSFAPLARLAAGDVVEWRVTARAAAVADVRFEVELNCDQFERPIIETESTNLY